MGTNPDKLREPLAKPLLIGTACSGSGAPSFALRELLGPHNVVEMFASEKHVAWQSRLSSTPSLAISRLCSSAALYDTAKAATREFFLRNNEVEHCYTDMVHARFPEDEQETTVTLVLALATCLSV